MRLGWTIAGLAAATLSLSAVAPALADDISAAPSEIVMAGNAFTTPDLVVPVGTTLTWSNTDGEEHDVVPVDPNFSLDPSFLSPAIEPGTSWSFTFTVPGTYDYMCDLHANMSATVTVQ